MIVEDLIQNGRVGRALTIAVFWGFILSMLS
jgi:hypothetical protein